MLAYLRVSTFDQADSGAGLDAQRAAITAHAQRLDVTIDAWHIDAGISGSIAPAARPALARALDEITPGDLLLVAKADRIARKAADVLALRDTAQGGGWTLAAADGSLDLTTPHGRAMTTVMAAFAELERELIATRTREALAARKAAGVRLGRPVVLAEATRERIGRERAQGATLQAIADGLNRDGEPTARGGALWRPSQVRAVLLSLDADAATLNTAQTR